MIQEQNIKLDFVGEDNIWCQVRTRSGLNEQRPILFLDRDGVIVEEVNYLHKIEDVHFINGVVKSISNFKQAGWRVVIVTNQAGIGRGYYGWNEFSEVNQYILSWLDGNGAVVDAVFAAPHHPNGVGFYQHLDHPMRKPNPGMLLKAAKLLNGNIAMSIIVGDNISDILAGQSAGLQCGYVVLSGHGPDHQVSAQTLTTHGFRVQIINDITDLEL